MQETKLLTVVNKKTESGSTFVLACPPQAFVPQCTVCYGENVFGPTGLLLLFFCCYFSGHLRYSHIKEFFTLHRFL